MKNIYSLLLGIIMWFSFNTMMNAQQRPTITPLLGGFTFPNQIVEEHAMPFNANSTDCGINFTRYYKYYSFKANFDMAFAFDLIATSPDFKFVIWRLAAGQPAESIFNTTSTIRPDRTVENTKLIKGMSEFETEICEGYSTPNHNGYVKAFTQEEALLKDETVVIAVYGNRITDAFDLKINVAEERILNVFNDRCPGDIYPYSDVKNKLIEDSGYTNVTLYEDKNFQQLINSSTNFSSSQTIYAQVKDETGKLLYIYTIPVSFQEAYAFYFNSVGYETCGNEFVLDFNQLIRDNVTNYGDIRNFKIEYVTLNGTRYTDRQTILLPEHFTRITGLISYIGSDACPATSAFSFSVRNIKYITDRNPIIETCSSDFLIDKLDLRIKTQVVNDEDYDIKFYLPNGTEVFDGNIVAINGNQLVLTYVPIHYVTGCIGTSGTITIHKIDQLPIRDANLSICLSELNQEKIDEKFIEMKNGVAASFQYFYQNVEVNYSQIENIIRTNRNGSIELRVTEGCPISKSLSFAVTSSSVNPVSEVYSHVETCQELDEIINYSTLQLKNIALQNVLHPSLLSNYAMKFYDEHGIEISSINDLTDERILDVFIRLNTESCSTNFKVKLTRQDKPELSNPLKELTASCDDTIVFTRPMLVELFGQNVLNYETSVEFNQPYEIQFNGNNSTTFSISFYNDINCQVTKQITIHKGSALALDFTAYQQTISNQPYRFCGEINQNELELYLHHYIDPILDEHSNLELQQTISEYAREMIAANGRVVIVFIDPAQCGMKELEFNYQPFPMPELIVSQNSFTCTGQLYELDLSSYEHVVVINQAGEEISGNNKHYQLGVGHYTLEVGNAFGCTVQKNITVSNYPAPVIDEIILDEESIKVLAQAVSGTLEYSLDGIQWQTSNQFMGIQKGVAYTIYVRENGCSIVSIPDVVYLNLPNFISPNGDGINDIWRPIGVNSTLDVRIQIFNRYGRVVYEAEGPNALNWDGKFHQKPLATDSYWYFIEYIDKKAVIKLKYQGYITIKSN